MIRKRVTIHIIMNIRIRVIRIIIMIKAEDLILSHLELGLSLLNK